MDDDMKKKYGMYECKHCGLTENDELVSDWTLGYVVFSIVLICIAIGYELGS